MEAISFRSGHQGGSLTSELPVVVCLGLCRQDIADGFEQAVVAEPSLPFQRGQSISRRGDLEHLTDRLDPVGITVFVDEVHQDLSRRSEPCNCAAPVGSSFRLHHPMRDYRTR